MSDTDPVVIDPGASLWAEFVAAHDLGADPVREIAREVVIETTRPSWSALPGQLAVRPAHAISWRNPAINSTIAVDSKVELNRSAPRVSL